MSSTPPPPFPARRGRKRKPRLVELRITIAGTEPPVWRRVRMPDTCTLHQLHRIIQLLFGWMDYHLYGFRVGERRFEAPDDQAEGEDSTAVRLSDLALSNGGAVQVHLRLRRQLGARDRDGGTPHHHAPMTTMNACCRF
jgi:hypothetical protein